MNTKLPLGAIVVGVDASLPSRNALGWAVDQAVREHRPLVIAHATGSAKRLVDGARGRLQARQERRIAGRRTVDDALGAAMHRAPGLRVQTLVRAAPAQAMLAELAVGAHLIVVGSRGLGPIGSVALGSVSVAVSSGADTPVVVVRAPGPGRRSPHIVVGTDATAASAAAIDFAFAQASVRGVPLTVLHCTSEAVLGVEGEQLTRSEVEFHTEERLRMAESIAGLREKYFDVRVSLRLAGGSPAGRLVEASGDADLVVVGARGHHGPAAALFGSVSQRVVESAACSVAVVHGAPQPIDQISALGAKY